MWTYLYLQYQQNATQNLNILSTASHADLLGAQNPAHTKLYEDYIGLKHDVFAKSWVLLYFMLICAYTHIFLLLQHRSIIAEMKAEMKDLQKELLQLDRKSVV